ncbi:MAG: endonuclease III [Candidatus Omnitrophica bacterium]|nr:endonuclease III [Candidatus Omnitrophota bacterium]
MTKEQYRLLQDYLNDLFPNAGCELIHDKDYEFVIEVMLSAQSTDIAVNLVSNKLFKKYPTLLSLAQADISEIEKILHPLGLFKSKAKNVVGIAQKIIEHFNGEIPSDKELLQELPGVGNKTAGVIRAEVFHIPDLPVDTHILRICRRLGISKALDTPLAVEKKLKKEIEQSRWILIHHQLIHFGRYFCTARKPNCENCKLNTFCTKK